DQFARRVLTLLARDGLVVQIGLFQRAGVVRIDADPLHQTAAIDLIFADNGDVVLRLARNDAGAAPGAGVHIDRHTPRIALAVVPIGIQGEVVGRILEAFVD